MLSILLKEKVLFNNNISYLSKIVEDTSIEKNLSNDAKYMMKNISVTPIILGIHDMLDDRYSAKELVSAFIQVITNTKLVKYLYNTFKASKDKAIILLTILILSVIDIGINIVNNEKIENDKLNHVDILSNEEFLILNTNYIHTNNIEKLVGTLNNMITNIMDPTFITDEISNNNENINIKISEEKKFKENKCIINDFINFNKITQDEILAAKFIFENCPYLTENYNGWTLAKAKRNYRIKDVINAILYYIKDTNFIYGSNSDIIADLSLLSNKDYIDYNLIDNRLLRSIQEWTNDNINNLLFKFSNNNYNGYTI